ncbi:hypothetical protein HY311_03930 [Candidatus Nomurabacteria bacterium]|nr:hypothetical protein [Candidatus Nomurabacteria bacterium]
MVKKIILILLGLEVLAGLGFLVVNKNNQTARPVTENPIKNTTEFSKEITLSPSDKITFSDGLSVVLKEINDSRCPKNVQCIWAGELAGTFDISGGKLTTLKEITLGTINNKSVTLDGYTFSLQNATVNKITILVQYEKKVIPT